MDAENTTLGTDAPGGSMDGEVALYWCEPDIFDEDDIDPQDDEWEAQEYHADCGDR